MDQSEEEVKLGLIVGRNIRSYRLNRGLSQFDLAHKVGVSGTTIQQAESGLTWPTRKTLLDISEALGCDPTDLIHPEVTAQDPTLPQAMLLKQKEALEEYVRSLEKLLKEAAAIQVLTMSLLTDLGWVEMKEVDKRKAIKRSLEFVAHEYKDDRPVPPEALESLLSSNIRRQSDFREANEFMNLFSKIPENAKTGIIRQLQLMVEPSTEKAKPSKKGI